MKPLSGKRVLLGVTGSIAAYKSIQIVRDLTSAGCEVQVVLTDAAHHFVPALALQILSKKKVVSLLFDPSSDAILHVTLATGFDLILIAPVTADFLAKMAAGLANDLLSTLLLATKIPILLAPAMDLGMWDHPAVHKNVAILKDRGCLIIDPVFGPLASGLEGIGRMADEQKIVDEASRFLLKNSQGTSRSLAKEVVLITAGPTREAIDPVRFISNRSSGKMGYALAEEAYKFGAKVILISGPVSLPAPFGVETIYVQSAEEMKKEVEQHVKQVTVVVMAAAVSDYTPVYPVNQKEKKRPQSLQIKLTDDILKGLSKYKKGRIFVGFAAETADLFENAWAKLKEKKLDLIVANDVLQEGAGFDTDTNIVDLIDAKGRKTSLPKMPKTDLARRILEEVILIRQAVYEKV
ncbi:MAG: bifunctional phosphopantothenoylcysteine decarboxylase/phosphopantothenate--cysteine ligase CoaBC [Nitrospirae bacterium]|nr:bifunctional phosphopantothenoylcysteine decarboxylase/phosphopantothenate--cysteine ligase CoaBC [Candidatus Troglogloeales bacterium]MBI3598339.1 bifunctional phosphopantothenoylcysteine decarboxylase/phosphopantothenate--cysteine ligase CoaBC [Candidatus Troglogloeales bacterium]